MAKGIFAADPCNAGGVPDFIPVGKRGRLRTEVPGRLWTFVLSGRARYLHVLRLRDDAGAPITVTPQNRCVYWVSSSNVPAPRARRLLKRIRVAAWRTRTMAQLIASNTAVANAVKASPDLKRPLTFAPDGTPLTFETALMHTVFGFDHPGDADTTTAAEVDGATEEAL